VDEETARIISEMRHEIDKLKAIEIPRQWYFLQSPLTSTAWDGDAFSTTAATTIDLSAVFGVPAGVKAVLVRLQCNDSAATADTNLVKIGPSATYNYQVVNRVPGSDLASSVTAVCNCDSNGDIAYGVTASGAGTMDVILQIWGYCI
jgi:hypothetical protein